MPYFSDYFGVSEEKIEAYGAFNISLVADLPLFIDPFLLFGSDKPEYVDLHKGILKYLAFLKGKAEAGHSTEAMIKAWYQFPEVKQNWFGYSLSGNGGTGLGPHFGRALSTNLGFVFRDLGNEKITQSSHLEKAGLFQIGVGRDHISDLTCNLVKGYLLEYTEKFAREYLDASRTQKVNVPKAYFDYDLERWMQKSYVLPYLHNDFVLLTPVDILTKDEAWINSRELYGSFERICVSIPNDQLRHEVNNFLRQRLPARQDGKEHSREEKYRAYSLTMQRFPEIVDYYIRAKEDNKAGAASVAKDRVDEVEKVFVRNVIDFAARLMEQREAFLKTEKPADSLEEARLRLMFLKRVIENNDGYRLFYVDRKPIKRESDLQILYKLTWYATSFNVDSEVNNGRGPVDFKVSKGASDTSLIEFKLASNSKLKRNLEKQVAVYEKANSTKKSLKAILYFTTSELASVKAILNNLGLDNDSNIVLIDGRRDNKPSASTA